MTNVIQKSGSINIKVTIPNYGERLPKAQQWLADRVLEDCKPLMPHLTGNFQQLSRTNNDGKEVLFPGPTARYLYRGVKMVDSETGKGPRKIPTGPGEYILRYRKGAKLVATDIPLKYSSPQAVPEWFEVAKRQHKDFWVKGVAEILGGK